MTFLVRFGRGVAAAAVYIGFAGMAITILGICVATLLRYGFGITFKELEEIVKYSAIYAIFFGAGANVLWGGHVAMSIVYSRFRGRVKKAIDLIINMCGVLISIYFTYAGIQYVLHLAHWEIHTEAFVTYQYVVFIAFPLGMAAMSIAWIAQLAASLAEGRA